MENKVYRVFGYYDMNIGEDEEILQEIYANENLAKERAKVLIAKWKQNGYTEQDAETWDEEEFRLYAYCDSNWNVDIGYEVENVLTEIQQTH